MVVIIQEEDPKAVQHPTRVAEITRAGGVALVQPLVLVMARTLEVAQGRALDRILVAQHIVAIATVVARKRIHVLDCELWSS